MPKISQLKKNNPKVYDSEGKKLINQVEIPRDSSFDLCKIKDFAGKFQREDLLLTSAAAEQFDRIITEYNFRKSFPKYLFRHKRRILFCGPPGTGKTFSAQVLSSVLQIPFILVNFEAVISSYLGTTARNLRKLFDYIEQIQNSVILFDEVIYYGLPDKKLREQIMTQYFEKLDMDSIADTMDFPDSILDKTEGLSIYDLKMIIEETAKTLLIEDQQLFYMRDLTPALDKYISRNELKIEKTD